MTVTATAVKGLTASGTVATASRALLSGVTDGAQVLVAGASSDGRIAAGFTVVTPAGTHVPVMTSGGTDVVLFRARPARLQVGSAIIAVGYAEPPGTVSALVAVQPPSWLAGAHGTVTVTVRDCSPAAIAHVVMALADGGWFARPG